MGHALKSWMTSYIRSESDTEFSSDWDLVLDSNLIHEFVPDPKFTYTVYISILYSLYKSRYKAYISGHKYDSVKHHIVKY